MLNLLLPANRTAREAIAISHWHGSHQTNTSMWLTSGPLIGAWLVPEAQAWQLEVDAMVARPTSRLSARPQQCQDAHLHRSRELHMRWDR